MFPPSFPWHRLQCCGGREHSRVRLQHTQPITEQPAFLADLSQSAVSDIKFIQDHNHLFIFLDDKNVLMSSLSLSMDNGPSLISSITLPPSSPSPSFSDSITGGGSLLNGPHSYTQASEGLKVRGDGGKGQTDVRLRDEHFVLMFLNGLLSYHCFPFGSERFFIQFNRGMETVGHLTV